MSTIKTKPFDPAEYLDDSESIAVYMSEALESGDPAFVADALGVVARARGMSEVAREVGMSRESLYRALSADGNPEFATVLRVVRALGLQLSAVPVEQRKSAWTTRKHTQDHLRNFARAAPTLLQCGNHFASRPPTHSANDYNQRWSERSIYACSIRVRSILSGKIHFEGNPATWRQETLLWVTIRATQQFRTRNRAS